MIFFGMSRIGYPSDVSRVQFELICPFWDKQASAPSLAMWTCRRWCAVLYVLLTDCQWRALPRDFSSWTKIGDYRKTANANSILVCNSSI